MVCGICTQAVPGLLQSCHGNKSPRLTRCSMFWGLLRNRVSGPNERWRDIEWGGKKTSEAAELHLWQLPFLQKCLPSLAHSFHICIYGRILPLTSTAVQAGRAKVRSQDFSNGKKERRLYFIVQEKAICSRTRMERLDERVDVGRVGSRHCRLLAPLTSFLFVGVRLILFNPWKVTTPVAAVSLSSWTSTETFFENLLLHGISQRNGRKSRDWGLFCRNVLNTRR